MSSVPYRSPAVASKWPAVAGAALRHVTNPREIARPRGAANDRTGQGAANEEQVSPELGV
jgi:hypothetical protein